MTRELAFYLKGRPNGGGANSVVQEFSTLVKHYGMGYLIVPEVHQSAFRLSYDWDDRILARVKTSLDDLPDDVIPVATTNNSVQEVRDAWSERDGPILYYVQDYEPLFYAKYSDQQRVACESYGQPNDLLAVVKTEWLRQTLLRETFLPVVKIEPSINRRLYFPGPDRSLGGRRTLLAMIRPATPRRAPHRTLAVVNRLACELGDRVDVVVFGADARELEAAGLVTGAGVHNAGKLTQSQVASLVRKSHYFLDLSDYQAFGRGLAEAMASAVLPIGTRYGAPQEFISDGMNGWLVDPQDLDRTFEQVAQAIQVDETRYIQMAFSAMLALSRWSNANTASDWMQLANDLT